MKYDKVICDYCKGFTIIKKEKYVRHLLNVHKIETENNFDMNIKAQKEYIQINNFIEKTQKPRKTKNQLAAELKKIKELEKKREREEYISKNTVSHYIIWDDIIFSKDHIKFDSTRLKTILKPIKIQGVFDSLNLIKKEYFQRLYPKKIFKLYFFEGDIVLEKSPGWKEIMTTIEFAKEFYEYKFLKIFNQGKYKIFKELSNTEINLLFEKEFSKSEYLKFLASLQNAQFKIVPVMEFINNHTEESFLFRILTKKNNILIIWENVNESRATHLFCSSSGNERATMNSIQEFICRNDLSTKREILHLNDNNSKVIKKRLNYFKAINHRSIIEYKYEIHKLIS